MIRGGGNTSDTVSVQETDAEADAAVTKIFEVSSGEEFKTAVNEINRNTSGTGNYVIKLTADITLPAPPENSLSESPSLLLKANTTTILGEGHTINTSTTYLRVDSNGTLNLGQEGYSGTLTLTGGNTNDYILRLGTFGYNSPDCTLNIYDGVHFENCAPVSNVLGIVSGTVNLYGSTCIKGVPLSHNNTVSSVGCIVYVGTSGTLNMWGHSCIDGIECTAGNGRGCVTLDGTLTMHDSSSVKNFSYETDSNRGTGVQASTTSTFIMNDNSEISNCTCAVYAQNIFTMNDNSKITNCTSTKTGSLYGGAGVRMSNNAVFTMNGNSSITNCQAYNGAAVNIYGGKFVMNGGSITNNTADQYGGGVCIQYSSSDAGTFELNGGTITGNHAKYGGGIYAYSGKITSTGGTICNNTADIYAADVCASAGSTLPAASGTTTDGNPIDGWYEDNFSRYSPENYGKAITSDDLTSKPYALIASYQADNIHTITIAEDDDGYAPGYAYVKDDSGNKLTITGTIPGKKVYLSYQNSNTLDSWTAKPDTLKINPATEDEDAWFVMPGYDVVISCKDHYEAPVIQTDISSSVIYPNEEAAFTLSITPNNEADNYALGTLHFDHPEAIQELYYFDLTDDTDSEEGSWRKLDVDNTGDVIFAYHEDTEDDYIDHELYLDPDEDVTECKFHATFNKKGRYALSATLRSTDDDEGNPVMGTMYPVPFTVGYALTLSDGVTLDDLKVNNEAPKYDDNGDLITKEGNELTFKKPDDTDDDTIYKFVDADGNETTLEPDEDGKFSITLPTGGGTIKLDKKSSPEPDIPADDSAVGTAGTDAAVIIGGAAIGAAAYLVGTQVWMETHLPDGVIPTNRQQMALMLWNAAGKPQPQSAVLYTDIAAAETDSQQAARWCVEQGLMKDYGETFKPGTYAFRPQVIKAWNQLQSGLKTQQ